MKFKSEIWNFYLQLNRVYFRILNTTWARIWELITYLDLEGYGQWDLTSNSSSTMWVRVDILLTFDILSKIKTLLFGISFYNFIWFCWVLFSDLGHFEENFKGKMVFEG